MKLSQHAQQRADERFGWSADILERMAAKALEQGREPKHFSGSFRRYLDREGRQFGSRSRVYGEYLYCFGANDTLTTLFQIPRKFRKAL